MSERGDARRDTADYEGAGNAWRGYFYEGLFGSDDDTGSDCTFCRQRYQNSQYRTYPFSGIGPDSCDSDRTAADGSVL